MTELHLDYETFSEVQLVGPKSVGLVNYMTHPSTEPLMLAWSWDDSGAVEQADLTDGDRIPPEVIEALEDPGVTKWAYNSAFERLATRHLLGVDTPIQGWKCDMALSYMRSFQGGLGDVGAQLGLPASQVKDPKGKKLIQTFSLPQRVTRNQPHLRRDSSTDPEAWHDFLEYNKTDVFVEKIIHDKLIGFPILPEEWELFWIDQEINDAGLPVDMRFVRYASEMAQRRKDELVDIMRELTSLHNPNSTQQLLPWLKERGYPFSDLQKNTIKKVLAENEQGDSPHFLDGAAVAALKLRQQASRTSVKKYDAIARRVNDDGRICHCFQFAGASRTNRWSGRGPQPQNLVRTPKLLEADDGDFSKLESTTDAIRYGDYDLLELLVDEPMVALAGCLRSSFRAPKGYEFVVCDLSAIESAVIAWLSGCKRMLGVFRDKKDPYRDFGTELYGKPYDEITKAERNICKPPTLGCGFGLGGGKLHNGKRTGLWGYAESMGVDITRQESERQVKLFRKVYSEIPAFWRDLDQAVARALKGKTVTVNGLLRFKRDGNFITMELPSGRTMFYHRPKIMVKEFPAKDGGTYEKAVFTHMGKSQITNKWQRIVSGGPKLCLGADTRVLTDRGWIPIVEVNSADRVWDGGEWVEHGGVVFNGYAGTITVDGVHMTPDHLVLTERGWNEAKNCDGRNRYETALPDGVAAHTWVQKRKDVLGSSVRLRRDTAHEGGEVSARRGPFVWMPEGGFDCAAQDSSWDVQTSGFSCVAVDARAMHVADTSVMEELRRQRDHGLQAVDDVRELLGRYGRRISEWVRLRPRGQRPGVFAVELPMGHSTSEQQQQEDEYPNSNTLGRNDGCGSVQTFRYWADNATLSARENERPVFDILNAGHNNRFVVAGEVGPFLVHNCENAVQAAARDVLAVGVRRAVDYGFTLVGSVHDEIICLQRKGDNRFTLEALREMMIEPLPWMAGLPLGAAGYVGELYRKD